MRASIAVPLRLVSALAWARTPTLEQADTDWSRLRLQGDASALAALLAEDWLLPRSDGRVQHRAGYLQGQELAKRTHRNTRIDNADVQVRGYGDTSVISGTRAQAATRNGQPAQGRAPALHLRVGAARWPLAEAVLALLAVVRAPALTATTAGHPWRIRTARPAARLSSAAAAARSGCNPATAIARARR